MLQRVLAFLLIIGLLAAAPLPGIAQDKDKDDKKADVKKDDDTKKDDAKKDDKEAPKDKPAASDKPAAAATHVVPIPSEWNVRGQWASEILPTVTLILIVVLFVLLLGVRSEIKNLEQKLEGHGDGKA
jgi:hypothetical protein